MSTKYCWGVSSVKYLLKDWDVTEHAKCLYLTSAQGLAIGTWCCLSDHALLTPINSHVNKQHQYLTHSVLSVPGELLYWSLYYHFNSSISYKRSKMHTALTLAECGWWGRELDLFCWCSVNASALIWWKGHKELLQSFHFWHFCNTKSVSLEYSHAFLLTADIIKLVL